jgi:hypothetical protein
MRTRVHIGVFIALLAVPGCSTIGGGSGSGGDGGAGDSCTTAEQCAGALICDPGISECADEVPCRLHLDCGDAAHCGDNGLCVKSATGSPCDNRVDCSFAEACIGGFCGCDGVTFAADPVPANMMIVLDRSGSMQCHIDGTDNNVGPNDPNSRWQHAMSAINLLVDTYGDIVNLGLAVYPNPNISPPSSGAVCVGTPPCTDCNPGQTLVDVGAGAGDAIKTALASGGANPGGCTPSGPAIQAQVGYAPLADPDLDNYVLFITDGAEACSSLTQVTAITNLRNQTPEVRTFVVGFTDQVNPAELNAAAEAGGTARPGAIKYYQANDGASLTAALAEIGGLALSCAFALDGIPPDLDELHVYADGQSVTRDPSQQGGWDYDPETNQVRIYGAICDALRAGDVVDVVIVHGCPVTVD